MRISDWSSDVCSSDLITVADVQGAAETGARTGAENIKAEGGFKLRWDKLGEFGRLAAEGRFSIPVAQTFVLDNWREAFDISLAGRARGKLVLLLHGRTEPRSAHHDGWRGAQPDSGRAHRARGAQAVQPD